MHIKTKALIKGVANKEWQGKHYYSVEVFGVEGNPADISVSVDIATQKVLFDTAEKIKPSVVDMVIDMTFFDRRPMFRLVSMQGQAAPAAAPGPGR